MKQYKINKGFIVQKLDQKTVIFDGEESMLYTFNETASFIFKKLKSALEEDKIVDALVKKYSINKERERKDVKELIFDLKKKKIVSSVKHR